MRKIINSKTKLFCLLFVLLIFSCEKNDSDFHIDQINPSNEGLIVLGDQLENPYSVENMNLAYEALRNENTLKSIINIEATHLYVRFKPKDNQEQTLLTRDSTIYIYDYPLDHKIVKRGTYYHDPSIPSNEITWQYTVVPVDYDFPNIHSQILEELYLPHYTSNRENTDNEQIGPSNWQALEIEALSMTGNLNENDLSVKKATEWRPSGSIKVHDDEIGSYTTTNTVFDHWEYYDCDTGEPVDPPQDPGLPTLKSTSRIEPPEYCQRAVYRTETTTISISKIPIEGIEVRARNGWFTTYSGVTDSNGNFTCNGTFTGDVTYSIKWENNYFDIRDGAYGQAYYNCIVWDLMDNHNQHGTNKYYPNDQVHGYTISQIEDAIPGIFGSWWTWRDNIKDNYYNSAENFVDTLFNQLK